MRKLLKTEQCQEGVRGIAGALAGAPVADTVEQVQGIVEQGFAVAHIAALVQEVARIVARVPAAADTAGEVHIVVLVQDIAAAVDIVAASALVAGNTEQVLPLAVAADRRAPVVAGALPPPPL